MANRMREKSVERVRSFRCGASENASDMAKSLTKNLFMVEVKQDAGCATRDIEMKAVRKRVEAHLEFGMQPTHRTFAPPDFFSDAPLSVLSLP